MGMFDSIKVERNLPYFKVINKDYLSELHEGEIIFQTKDLDLILDTYVIKEDGLLQVEGERYGKIGPHLIEFHGTLEFYAMEKNYWICYNANFINGNCEDIKLINFEHIKDGDRIDLIEEVRSKGDNN